MAATIDAAVFDDCALDVHGVRADDGSRFTFALGNLRARSTATDPASHAVARLGARLHCRGRGAMTVRLHGRASLCGAGGWAVVLGRVAGRMLIHNARMGRSLFDLAVGVAPSPSGVLRMSLLLVTQCDAMREGARAVCTIDAIEVDAAGRAA